LAETLRLLSPAYKWVGTWERCEREIEEKGGECVAQEYCKRLKPMKTLEEASLSQYYWTPVWGAPHRSDFLSCGRTPRGQGIDSYRGHVGFVHALVFLSTKALLDPVYFLCKPKIFPLSPITSNL
jgi:hypothetical protein